METRVQKWGNSLAVRIPRAQASQIGLESGSPVRLSLRNMEPVVVPSPRSRLTLDDLLAQVTEENLHAEADTGPAVGGEEW